MEIDYPKERISASNGRILELYLAYRIIVDKSIPDKREYAKRFVSELRNFSIDEEKAKMIKGDISNNNYRELFSSELSDMRGFAEKLHRFIYGLPRNNKVEINETICNRLEQTFR